MAPSVVTVLKGGFLIDSRDENGSTELKGTYDSWNFITRLKEGFGRLEIMDIRRT